MIYWRIHPKTLEPGNKTTYSSFPDYEVENPGRITPTIRITLSSSGRAIAQRIITSSTSTYYYLFDDYRGTPPSPTLTNPDYEVETPNQPAQTIRITLSIAGLAVAQRVVTSSTSTYYYLFTDHLGSTSVLATSSGNQVSGSKASYYPFGSPRTTPTQTITDRNFTGQKENMELGLIYYNARFYLPTIARFLTPDTLIPNPQSPQSFNRYTYTLNNPTRFTDPSGHVCYDPITDAATPGCTQPSPKELAGALVSFQVAENVDEVWTAVEKAVIYQAAYDVGKAFANNINAGMRVRLSQVGETYQDITPQAAFLQVYGGVVTFTKTGQSCKEATGTTICYAETQTSRSIHVFTDIYESKGESLIPDIDTGKRWAVHELGHAFESRVNGQTSWGYVRNSLTADVSNRNGFAGPFNGWQQSQDNQNREIFADMFIGWVYGRWEMDRLGFTDAALLKQNFMNVNMSIFINIASH